MAQQLKHLKEFLMLIVNRKRIVLIVATADCTKKLIKEQLSKGRESSISNK